MSKYKNEFDYRFSDFFDFVLSIIAIGFILTAPLWIYGFQYLIHNY